jgi:SagB-type dehydrogenase family enzyme
VLEPIRHDVESGTLSNFLLAEAFAQHANVILFLTTVFKRTQRKYGPRGYRYVLLEAGHVAQNFCLLAAERNLGSLCIGGFMDYSTNRFLGIDGLEEAAIYAVAIGWPADGDRAYRQ